MSILPAIQAANRDNITDIIDVDLRIVVNRLIFTGGIDGIKFPRRFGVTRKAQICEDESCLPYLRNVICWSTI